MQPFHCHRFCYYTINCLWNILKHASEGLKSCYNYPSQLLLKKKLKRRKKKTIKKKRKTKQKGKNYQAYLVEGSP